MTLGKAIKMGKNGRIEDWVHEYLMQPHPAGNVGFSEGLKRAKRYWIGPVKIDLSVLIQICGPSRKYRFHENKRTWDLRIKENIKKLKCNENPPPLIVEYKKKRLLIADGNHRFAALRDFGVDKYWVILWFNSKNDYEKYMHDNHVKGVTHVLPDNRRGSIRKINNGRTSTERTSRNGLS